MRYILHLAYNGKPFHGWQIQPNAPSIQEELQLKLQVLLKHPIDMVGCGRTDTGVHAKNYFAHFDSEVDFDPNKICFQLNALLPHEIAIYSVIPTHDQFHARFDAIQRAYQYVISTKPNPFLLDFSTLYTKPLNIELMNDAAQILLGHSDFECFSKVHTDVKTFICYIKEAKWVENDNGTLVFHIKADRFLRNMVRAIVGTLMEVGSGKKSLEAFEAVLKSKNRSEAGMSVPAKGLFLTEIHYPTQPAPNIL